MNNHVRIATAVLLSVPVAPVPVHPQETPSSQLPLPVLLSPSVGEAGASASALRWLDDAVRAALPNAGLAALSGSPFRLGVRVTSREVGRSEAGMQIVLLVESAVTFDLRSSDDKLTLGSARVQQRGNGKDVNRATESSIAAVARDEPGLVRALSEIATQAVAAYESSCETVLGAARARSEAKAFNDGIAIAMTVPVAAARCRSRARSLATTIYNQRAQYICGTALQQARAARAAGNLLGALDRVDGVDPLSPCAGQVAQLINDVGQEAAAQRAQEVQERAETRRQEMALASEALKAYTTLEQKRIAVLGEIAKAALKQPVYVYRH
jgi:hypothetical protein